MRFALQEATIILATLLARFRLTPVPGARRNR
jgi:cytochrome P450